MTVEYATLAAYMVLLLVIGAVVSRFNRGLSDYVRGGAQGLWWMVGASMLMSGISASTFTGMASAAFTAGPTFLAIYLANAAGYLAAALLLAGWFRQTRAYTALDIARERCGVAVEQFLVVLGVMLAPFGAGVQLWALATFASGVFDLPLVTSIVVIGAIVVVYSTSGGKWAVMATDFVQGVIMIGMTLLVFVLSIRAVGGWGAFFDFFADPRFAADFSLVKDAGQFSENRFTWHWIVVIFVAQFLNNISLNETYRYLPAKDGREARRAAWLAFVLMLFGIFVWFVPVMVARFLYESEVLAAGRGNPGENAYAFIAMRLLPQGLGGVMIATMFSATMSSMDTGLNAKAGIIMRNFVPRIREWRGLEPLSEARSLIWCRLVTLVLGGMVISGAVILASQDRFALFDAFFMVNSVVGMPVALPMTAALYIKKLPRWSYFFTVGLCLVPSIWSLVDERLFGRPWSIQDRFMWVIVAAATGTLISRLCYGWSGDAYRRQVEVFFERMRSPVDFVSEVGESRDADQLTLMGRVCLVVGILLGCLLFAVDGVGGIVCVLALAAFTSTVGGLLLWRGRRLPSGNRHPLSATK